MTEETKNVAFRLPGSLLERLDRYVEAMRTGDPWVTYTRADAVRRLLHQGLERWEAEHLPPVT